MSTYGPSVTQALHGVALGLQFDPYVAGVTAVIAAALSGYPKAPGSRVLWSALVVVAGWAVGDGIRILGAPSPGSMYSIAWGATALLVGYALPAWAGAQVGRRVVHGTGWLAAGAVALMLTPAVSVLADSLSRVALRAA